MTNLRCLRSICPGRKKIPENEEDPIKDPSTQMCSRSRQKSILPDTRCPRIPRRMKKIQEQISPENLQQRSPVIRRRLSADKCRGIPMWIGQSSHSNSEAILSETWANRYPPRTWMWTRSWVPSRSSDHPSPGPQCRLFLRSCYETRICTAADSCQAEVQRGEN